MNRKYLKKMSFLVSLFVLTIISGAVFAQDAVVGPTSLATEFPDVFGKYPTCKNAYNKYLKVAEPVKACHDYEDAQWNFRTQKTVIESLKDLKGKNVDKKIKDATQNANMYENQMVALRRNCPEGKKFVKAVHKLDSHTKDVCRNCNNSWPGKIGPAAGDPCN